MVSAVFMLLGCCAASVPASRAWSRQQLPLLERLRQPLIPWEDPGGLPLPPDSVERLKKLILEQPKRAFTLLSSGASKTAVANMLKSRIGKFRRPETGRPRGHPLRWG